jgi:hypothetical protein
MMIRIRTQADVNADREVVVKLPPETPIGRADLIVMVLPITKAESQRGILRRHFGAYESGNSRSADNASIDADLAREYGGSNKKA